MGWLLGGGGCWSRNTGCSVEFTTGDEGFLSECVHSHRKVGVVVKT